MVLKLVLVLLGCAFSEAARILAVFPIPSISHQVVFRPLTQELVKRGHEVVVITTDPAFAKGQAPANLTEIDVHDISYNVWRKNVLNNATITGKSDDLIKQVRTTLPSLSEVFEMQMRTNEVQKVLNDNRTFNLILAEACVRPAISVSHVFNVPIILVSSFGGTVPNYDAIGVPSRQPLLYPTMLRQRINNLSFREKLSELHKLYLFKIASDEAEKSDNKIIKRLFGPDTPTIHELQNNVHMLFLNVHPVWDSNRPVPPSVVYMGGIHQTPSKALPEDLKFYLDSSKHGVIYISFGTNVSPSSLPPERIQLLVRAFSRLPYNVLWKWDKDELPGRASNIRISKWLPQSDLLKHPKVKLFITQGGLQSTDEALTAGVPLIGMPLLIDQWYNVEQYVHHKIGLRLDMETVTEDSFTQAITTVIEDDSYRKNMKNLHAIMKDQPQPPIDRAIWWTEHVLRHGGAPHLRAPAANMSWTEYLDAELLGFLAISVLAVIVVLSVTLYLLIGLVKRNVLSSGKLKSS